MSLTVVSAGPLTLVQDDGRPGLASQGVGPSGAFDRRAMHQARALGGDAGRGTAGRGAGPPTTVTSSPSAVTSRCQPRGRSDGSAPSTSREDRKSVV